MDIFITETSVVLVVWFLLNTSHAFSKKNRAFSNLFSVALYLLPENFPFFCIFFYSALGVWDAFFKTVEYVSFPMMYTLQSIATERSL
jgi:hypothetical protein